MSAFSFDILYQSFRSKYDHWDAVAKALEYACTPWPSSDR